MVLRCYADNLADITARIHSNEQDRTLYTGMKRFMSEDLNRAEGESGKQFKRRSGEMAKKVTLRSRAYSAMIADKMPDAFRLSIHPYGDWTEKVPVRLVPSSDRWATPWHNAAVYDDRNGTISLMHRDDAEARGYGLEYRNGKPWLFLAPPNR